MSAKIKNPAPSETPVVQAVDFSPEASDPKPLHRKIARLPRSLRDRINSMLDDSATYHQIIAQLKSSTAPPLPYPISEMDLSRWKSSGYQRYLEQQDRLDSLRATREHAVEVVASGDTSQLPEATLQIIASQYYHFLAGFSPECLKEKLAEDPLKYTRFLNVFARLTREILSLKKHREECEREAASKLKCRKEDPDLAEFRQVASQAQRELISRFSKTIRSRYPGHSEPEAAPSQSHAS
jgi:hypothetical protein